MKRTAHLRQGAQVLYQTRILNADGSVHFQRDWKKNLIYDNGLNMAATDLWTNCFKYACVGTGTTPTFRDSGLTTVSLAAGVLTASAGFFDPADVGRLFKADSGEEVYITGYTSATVCATTSVLAFAASTGTIWYVNDNSLTTEIKRTGTYTTGGAFNGTTFASPVLTHKRTFIFSAEAGAVTYKEIGWSNAAGAGANLFGRDLIPGAGDSLVAGQQYQVTVRLLLTIGPVTIQAAANLGGPFDTTGTYNLQFIGSGDSFSIIDTNGVSQGFSGLEPSMNLLRLVAENANYALNAGPSFTNGAYSGTFVNCTSDAYVTGSFTRTISGRFLITDANYTIYGFSWGVGNRGLSLLFTTPQVKDSSHTLTAVLRTTWQRILSNP